MKKTFITSVFCFSIVFCFSQAGEWVWIHGSMWPGQPGNFGVQGVPSPLNNPPGLYEASEWTDLNGNFWLWGGNGGGNDLWRYNPATNEWTWMKSGLANYGTQGIPSPNNNPPPRWFGAATWVDTTGNFWMFGGHDTAAFGTGNYSDLWKYNISTNEWTWMKGPNITGQPGYYGTQGVPDPLNYPAGRSEAATSWTDDAGDLWLFGGGAASFFNDLWRYNIATNQWTWMKGSPLFFQDGFHGLQGVEGPMNTPRSQMTHCRWKDNSGLLWMFGGGDAGWCYNTLWRYNVHTNNWAWISGDTTINSLGSYGTKCLASTSNSPSARYENRAAWTDPNGDFWFFGGLSNTFYQKNDLWKYCISTNQWIWVSGDSTGNPQGNWGTLGISSPTNKPNRRFGSVAWTDNNWHFYFFGGFGAYNDLWKYTIDTTCGVCPAPAGLLENNATGQIQIFPNPATNELTISNYDFQKGDKIILTDIPGKIIFKKNITAPASEIKIQISGFSNGIYFLQLKTKDELYIKKIVIQHY